MTMMLERNKNYTREDLLNNPPKKEHLTYKNSLEVGLLEVWQGYEQTLEAAMNFLKTKTNELRNMINRGTTWEEITKFSDQVAEEFEYFQDVIKWEMF